MIVKCQTGKDSKQYEVLYKKPTAQLTRVDLSRIGLQYAEYEKHYQSPHKLSAATKLRLATMLQYLETENPYIDVPCFYNTNKRTSHYRK